MAKKRSTDDPNVPATDELAAAVAEDFENFDADQAERMKAYWRQRIAALGDVLER